MSMIYLVGNGYVSDYISQIKIENKKYVGVCRSEKKNCDINIKLDISVDNEKLKELITEKSIVIYCHLFSSTTTKWMYRFSS